MRWARWLTFVVVLCTGVCAFSQAAQLDLRTALQTAELNNWEMRAARQQRALALAGITTARQLPNPTVTFSTARDSPHQSVVWDQPIELGGKRSKRIAVAEEEQRAAEVDISILSRQIRRRTREAFYRALSARAQTEQAKAALDLALRLREIVQQRFEAGDVAQLEVIQADVEVARTEADYELTAQSQRSAEVQLAALLSRQLDQPLSLAGKLEELPPPQLLARLTEIALRANPEVQRTAQDLKVEERRLDLARAQRIPTLGLQAGTDLNAPPDFQVGPRGQIGITLTLLYRGRGEIALSSARVKLLQLTLHARQINASAQVASTFFDFAAKRRQAEQYAQKIVPETVRLEEMAEDSYRSGRSNLLILIDAQRRLNDVRRAYIESMFAVQDSFAILEEAVGAPLD